MEHSHTASPPPRASSRRSWRGLLARVEHGFTIIEIMVACTLFAIVVALMVQGLVESMGSASRATVIREAEDYSLRALESLQDDARSIRAFDRNFDAIREVKSLRDWVMLGQVQRHPITNARLDLRDVLQAAPQRFAFRADVSAAGARPDLAECVTYDARRSGASFELVRYVTPAGGACPSLGGQRTVIIPRRNWPTWVTTGAGPTFQYELMCDSTRCPGIGGFPKQVASDGNKCALRTSNSVTGTAMNWVVGVRFDIISYSERGGRKQDSKASGASTASIRTRTQHDYLYALGCEG